MLQGKSHHPDRNMNQEKENIKKWQKVELIFELLVFGIVLGVVEDIIAVKIVTGEPITWRVVGIIVVIAIPFAIIGEMLVDRIDFVRIFQRIFGKK